MGEAEEPRTHSLVIAVKDKAVVPVVGDKTAVAAVEYKTAATATREAKGTCYCFDIGRVVGVVVCLGETHAADTLHFAEEEGAGGEGS